MGNKTVTSKIDKEYQTWKVGENIILDIAMGRGKTFFIVNVLSLHAFMQDKQILYLCNRSKLAQEVIEESNSVWCRSITVKTYQAMQMEIEEEVDILAYDYIVCDECHYLLKEGWNDKTDIMYRWLKDNQSSCKIFMSATGQNIFPYIKRWGEYREYKLEADYSYIKKIVFYDKDEYIYNLMEQIPDDEKVIYFSRKLENAYKAYEHHFDKASFICSSHSKSEYKQYISQDALINGILSKQITCSTSVWDNGINIKDDKLKHIVCDFEDTITLIQAIGRKRVGRIANGEFVLSDNDNITLHIRNWNKQSITQFLNPKMATYIECNKYLNDDKEWIEEQNKKRHKYINQCLYVDYESGKIEMNHIRYMGLKKEIERLKYAKAYGFTNYILKGLGDSFMGNIEYVSVEEEKRNLDLELFKEYLNNKVATRLFDDDKEELKLEFAKTGLKIDGGRTMGLKTMNAFMEDNDIPFKIESSRVRVKGKLYTVWTIL